jgi:hypothetical protein
VPARRLADLKGRRIAIGADGSGTKILALQLLGASGLDGAAAQLVEIGGTAAIEALAQGRVDAVITVIAEPSAAMTAALTSGRARLLSLDQADAYTMRFPFLTPVRLPMGAIDLGANVPPTDVTLIAPTAALVARNDLHPALVMLLLDVAHELHSGRQLFAPAKRFPSSDDLDFPLDSDAQRYFTRGPSFLFRTLPFSIAVWLERMVVLIIPLVTLLLPVIRFGPPAYRWQVQRKIYRRYKRVRQLEEEARTADAGRRGAIASELDDMQIDLAGLKVPASYAQQLYQLRLHLDFVRTRLGDAAAEAPGLVVPQRKGA